MKRIVCILILCIITHISFAQTDSSGQKVLYSTTDSALLQQNADTLHKIQPDTAHTDTTKIFPQDTITHKETSKTGAGGYVISGKVADKNTGEGVPFATVYIPGTPVGTAADLNGNFVIKTETLPKDILKAQAIGYDTAVRTLDKSKHEYEFYLELERSSTQINEVVVHAGEDPAVVLFKNIIKHKPDNNPDKTENYKYQAYNKLELDISRLSKSQFEKIPLLRRYSFIYDNVDTDIGGNPVLPLYLTETLSEYYFQRHPKKQREFIKASLVKGTKNQSITKYLGSLYQTINIYKNFIPVFDLRFVSPISNAGLFYYHYKIMDTEYAYGHRIILMEYTPRRQGENCFRGDFWVVDTAFAIQRMSMEVPKLANINWVNRVSLYQEFAPINDSLWFCIKDKFVADFSAYPNIPGVTGRKTTTYKDIVVNDTSVTNVLDDKKWKEEVIVNDSARSRTSAWWATHRPDSLSKTEKGIYKMVDTINSMPITIFYKNTIKFLVTGVKDIGPIELGPYFYVYSNNSIEGNRFRISMGTPHSIKDAHFTWYVAYGDKDKQYKYGADGLWLLNRKPREYLYASYVHDFEFSTHDYGELRTDNIFSTLFRKPGIPFKLAFVDEELFQFYRENYKGFGYQFTLQHRQYTPYSPLPAAGIFTDNSGNPANSVTNTEATLDLRYAYKEKFLEGQYLRVSLGSRYPIADLELAQGLKGVLNSGYNYQRVRFSVSQTLKIPPLGNLYYKIYGGKYFGTLPYPLLENHPGNEYYYYNFYAFEMMNQYEFLSDQYAGVNLEHDIGGGIFNYIPLLKRLKLRQFWTAKAVIGSLSDANSALNLNKGYPFRTLQGTPYTEVGTGVSNILHLFRIDFVWRLTPQPLPTEMKSKYFGIFGSVQFVF